MPLNLNPIHSISRLHSVKYTRLPSIGGSFNFRHRFCNFFKLNYLSRWPSFSKTPKNCILHIINVRIFQLLLNALLTFYSTSKMLAFSAFFLNHFLSRQQRLEKTICIICDSTSHQHLLSHAAHLTTWLPNRLFIHFSSKCNNHTWNNKDLLCITEIFIQREVLNMVTPCTMFYCMNCWVNTIGSQSIKFSLIILNIESLKWLSTFLKIVHPIRAIIMTFAESFFSSTQKWKIYLLQLSSN